MKRYTITLNGCDDCTQFQMELAESEAALVERIAAVSREASTYGCMPTMDVKPWKPSDDEG